MYKQNLLASLSKIGQNDPNLYDELQTVRKNEEIITEAAQLNIVDHGLSTEVIEVAGPSEISGDLALETIVLKVGRPVLAIHHDNAVLQFRDVQSEVWRDRLLNVKPQLIHAAQAVGRIELKNDPTYSWVGTGWLVAKDIIVTNRHVAQVFSKRQDSKFIFRQNNYGLTIQAKIDFLEEIDNESELAFQLVSILHIEEDGPDMAFLRVEQAEGNTLGQPIELSANHAVKLQQVAVIGYPARDSRIPDAALMSSIFGDVYDKKRLAPGQITFLENNQLAHDCSTLGGNSGSVVLDLVTGEALGLHFAGRFLENNFAVPAILIKERLEKLNRNSRQLSTVQVNYPKPQEVAVVIQPSNSNQQNMITIPLQLEITIKMNVVNDTYLQQVQHTTNTIVQPEEFLTEASPTDYVNRVGFEKEFLKDYTVPLPTVKDENLQKEILTFEFQGKQESELKYQHFSVLMHKSRRQCFFSAVNIEGLTSIPMPRTGWRLDPRIPAEAQIMKECYGNAPKFSRGHMTRREDPIWGTPDEASLGNSDSMHVTNTVPQMQTMNAGIWLALENYALHHARKDDMRICVFTGPVFAPGDPVKYGVIIPLEFWKIIAFIHDDTGKLCATGYRMSQKDYLSENEFVYGEHNAAQVSIASIEKDTGLSFGQLKEVDPFTQINELASNDLIPQNNLDTLTKIKFY